MVDQLLGARADDDLILIADYAPHMVQIIRDFRPQHRFALPVALCKQKLGRLVQHLPDALLPLPEIKGFRIRQHGNLTRFCCLCIIFCFL